MSPGKKYYVNWAKAFIYLVPQMPNHPRRSEMIEMMRNDEPRMIQNFRMRKKFKQEAQEANPGIGEMQIQQIAMMKMQEHMMKNGNAMQMNPFKPPPEQQKAMMLQMLGHLKQQFRGDAELYGEF